MVPKFGANAFLKSFLPEKRQCRKSYKSNGDPGYTFVCMCIVQTNNIMFYPNLSTLVALKHKMVCFFKKSRN